MVETSNPAFDEEQDPRGASEIGVAEEKSGKQKVNKKKAEQTRV